jgi:hypothetical protein
MKGKFIKSVVCLLISAITQFAFAEDTAPFDIGEATFDGNGCPEGTYSVVLSPDGTELSILFSSFTAETDEDHRNAFANCSVAIPIDIPSGITVGLMGVDYRGLSFIPSGGSGMLYREYFFAGQYSFPQISSIHVYDAFYPFYYSDTRYFAAWTECGDDIIARSNAFVSVSRPPYPTDPDASFPDEAFMTVFSEDWDLSILFHLVWDYC